MRLIVILFMLFGYGSLEAQNLVYDPTFPMGGGATNGIFRMLQLPDERVLLGGAFPAYGGVTGRGLVRILPNGQRDAAFNVGTGVTTRVQELVAGNNGRVYVGGLFTTFNGTPVGDFVCLDSSGNIDPSFAAGTGFNNEVTAIDAFPNGDIVVGGFFNQYKGQAVSRPVKIFANGQLDTAFNTGGSGAFGIIDAICIQPDQKILLAGTFTQYNGQAASRLIRLNPSGSRDSTFDLNLTFSGSINEITLLPDGRILAGGTFLTVNGLPLSRIARILPNGQPDLTFTPGTGFNGTVRTVVFTAEGQIAVGGDFTNFNGISTNRIAVLDTNGNLAFGSGTCATSNGTIYAVASRSDQSLIVGGVFSQMGSAAVQRIARLTRANSLNSASLPNITASSTTSCAGQRITLNLSAGNLNGASSWQWYSGSCGGTAVGQSSSIFVFPLVTTTYFVRGEGSCVAAGPCDSITIIVQDTQAPVPVVANLPNLHVACGMFINPALADDNCLGTIVGVANRSLTFTSPGTYNILWTYTDTAGNSSAQHQTVIVDTLDTRISYTYPWLEAADTSYTAYQWVRCDLGFLAEPQANTWRFQALNSGDYAVVVKRFGCSDTSRCLNVSFTSVQNKERDVVSVYPNPASNQLTISTPFDMKVALLDVLGRTVFETSLAAGLNPILLPALQQGTYFWHFENKSMQYFHYQKQIIQP